MVERLLERAAAREREGRIGWGEDALGRLDRSPEPGDLASFLARAYNLKTVADYAVGADVAVSASEAADAIEGAARFVDAITRAVSERP